MTFTIHCVFHCVACTDLLLAANAIFGFWGDIFLMNVFAFCAVQAPPLAIHTYSN